MYIGQYKKKYLLFSLLFILLSTVVFADNPLVRHIYTADPAPIIHDGKFYIFTGHDEGGTGWTLKGWHVLSSTDMVNWTDHGDVLSCSNISWLNANQAWASQCVERNGKFYFYICDSGEIGVAVADNILGPYKDALGHPLITNATKGACPGDDNIDPSVFIDDDGQAYIYWGTDGVSRQAKLKSNMIEIDGSITVPQGINKFFEASWVHKRNGIYYYSYAAYNSSGKSWPSNIDYATSSNPLGPWTYKGTLNDYAGTGTNHSGIVQYNDLWYFVYHTDYLSGGTAWERSVQIDYLNYNTDGTIKKIVQTTAGLAPLGNTPFLSNEFYKIRARHSGKLMTVAGASKANEGNVEQSSDEGNYCQQWRFIEIERGVYEIVNRNSGLALDANLSNNNVLQYEYLGTANQKWKITGAGNGSFYIVNKANNRMLEVYYAEMTDRSNIQHWGFNGETCQQWDLVRNDSTTTQINKIEIDNNQYRFLKEIKATTYFSTRSDIASDASEMFDLTGRILGNKTVTIKKSSGFFIRNTNR